MLDKLFRRADGILGEYSDWVYWAALSLFIGTSIIMLGIAVFDDGKTLPEDPKAFIEYTNGLTDVLAGKEGLWQYVHTIGERTYIFELPIAIVAQLIHVYDYRFYLILYWLFYVVPIPFLFWRIAKYNDSLSYHHWVVPLVILCDPLVPYLSAGGYFTDIPPISLSLLSFHLFQVWVRRDLKIFAGASALALSCALLVRWQTMSYVAPMFAIAAIATMREFPWRVIVKKAAVFSALVTIYISIALSVGELWVTVKYTIGLMRSWDSTIWRYGNGGTEYHHEGSIFLFRLGEYVSYSLFALLSTTVIGILGTGVRSRERRLIAFSAVLIILGNLLWASFYFSANERYIVPEIFVVLLLLALSPTQRAWRRVLVTGLVPLLVLDTDIYNITATSAQGVRAAPYNELRQYVLDATGGRNSSSGPLAMTVGKNYFIPYEQVLTRLDALRVSMGRAALSVDNIVPPVDAVPGASGLRFNAYRLIRRKENPAAKEQFRRIRFSGRYVAEMKVPSIYDRYLRKNARALETADAIIVPWNIQYYWKNWWERKVAASINDKERNKQKSPLGLRRAFSFDLIPTFQRKAIAPKYTVYSVTDRREWSRYVVGSYCRFRNRRQNMGEDPLCVMPSVRKKKELDLAKGTMADGVWTGTVNEKPAVILHMKAAPVGKYWRVFVHFVPRKRGNECRFFVKDHNPVFPLKKITFAFLDARGQERLKSCRYQVKVGVALLDARRRNIFSFGDFVEATKDGQIKSELER